MLSRSQHQLVMHGNFQRLAEAAVKPQSRPWKNPAQIHIYIGKRMRHQRRAADIGIISMQKNQISSHVTLIPEQWTKQIGIVGGNQHFSLSCLIRMNIASGIARGSGVNVYAEAQFLRQHQRTAEQRKINTSKCRPISCLCAFKVQCPFFGRYIVRRLVEQLQHMAFESDIPLLLLPAHRLLKPSVQFVIAAGDGELPADSRIHLKQTKHLYREALQRRIIHRHAFVHHFCNHAGILIKRFYIRFAVLRCTAVPFCRHRFRLRFTAVITGKLTDQHFEDACIHGVLFVFRIAARTLGRRTKRHAIWKHGAPAVAEGERQIQRFNRRAVCADAMRMIIEERDGIQFQHLSPPNPFYVLTY